ncbi:MAG: glycosyltransferase family 2 protein [Proteobacteria bacterium]|nr:glycosyltransferase family 2 protein [Pseudomonadota bacterium]
MQPAPDLEISVIVVNFNAGGHLVRCLRALAAQTFADFEVLVIDNDSRDSSFVRARELVGDPRFVFRANERNLGFAAATNRAAEMARGRWLAVLNPDAFPEPGWLGELVGAARRNPGVRMFGSTQIDDADPSRLDGAGDGYSIFGIPWRGGHGRPVGELPAHDYSVFSACAAAAFYDAALFRALDGFDETFFCYCEDVDFGFRARLAGERCMQAPAATVRHVGGASSTDGRFAREYGVRNMILTHLKNMPGALLWASLPLLVLATAAAILARPRLAFAGMRGAVRALARLGPVLRARRSTRRVIPLATLVADIAFDPRAVATKAIRQGPVDEPARVA